MVALVFLVLFSSIFLDIRRIIPEAAINTVTWLQFVPSLLKFLKVVGIGAAGFLVVAVLTLLFGRIYCSAICPLGILQDVFTRISNRYKKKKNRIFRFTRPWTKVRYGLLILSFLGLLFGTVLFIDLLDPYSNFGRIFTFFVKPVVVWFNNIAAGLLEQMDVYVLAPVNVIPVPIPVFLIQLFIFGVVVWFSLFYGRLFCNTICPVGTLLGWISKVSLFRIRFDESTCTYCGLCGYVCKASCLDMKNNYVDVSRCISCFNCLTVCKSSSVVYGLPKRDTVPAIEYPNKGEEVDVSKRKLILGSLAFWLGMAGISMAREKQTPQEPQDTLKVKIIPKNVKPTTIKENRERPVCPPGSASISQFNDKCTACNLCVNACPSDVLQPSLFEYGLMGLLQPRMDYWSGYCNHECIRCLEVCPTGAILPLEKETKMLTQLGITKFVKDNCIVHTDKTDCGACSEHCPTKAVKMIPYEDTELVIPEVTNEICIGCGACEFACPTTPYKAIYVKGNALHKLAEKPKQEALEEPDVEEEFPF